MGLADSGIEFEAVESKLRCKGCQDCGSERVCWAKPQTQVWGFLSAGVPYFGVPPSKTLVMILAIPGIEDIVLQGTAMLYAVPIISIDPLGALQISPPWEAPQPGL